MSLPPQLMVETSNPQTLTFRGERMTWVSPVSLEELVQLKTRNPEAPLVMGNTNIGIHLCSIHQGLIFHLHSELTQCCFVSQGLTSSLKASCIRW